MVKCHQVGWKSEVKNIGENDSNDEAHTVMCSVRGGGGGGGEECSNVV